MDAYYVIDRSMPLENMYKTVVYIPSQDRFYPEGIITYLFNPAAETEFHKNTCPEKGKYPIPIAKIDDDAVLLMCADWNGKIEILPWSEILERNEEQGNPPLSDVVMAKVRIAYNQLVERGPKPLVTLPWNELANKVAFNEGGISLFDSGAPLPPIPVYFERVPDEEEKAAAKAKAKAEWEAKLTAQEKLNKKYGFGKPVVIPEVSVAASALTGSGRPFSSVHRPDNGTAIARRWLGDIRADRLGD